MNEEDMIKQIDNLTANQVNICKAIFELHERVGKLESGVKVK